MNRITRTLDRRDLLRSLISATVVGRSLVAEAAPPAWRPQFVLASCLYGTWDLADILPQLGQLGIKHVDLWPRIHGNQREQAAQMGPQAFTKLLADRQAQVGVLTRYDLGPLRIHEEFEFARSCECGLIVTGSTGPAGLKGEDLKAAIGNFLRQLEPQLVLAEKQGLTIGIENHADSLIASPDGIRRLAEMAGRRPLGIALAPYHLPQDPVLIANLIEELGDKLVHFYAWQHGLGADRKLSAEEQLSQLPGRGPLDFQPIVAALAKVGHRGFTEVFMHPVPRGVPIRDTLAEVTAEVARAQKFVEALTSN